MLRLGSGKGIAFEAPFYANSKLPLKLPPSRSHLFEFTIRIGSGKAAGGKITEPTGGTEPQNGEMDRSRPLGQGDANRDPVSGLEREEEAHV